MTQPGLYRAKAHVADLGTASTGKEQIAIQFRLLEGPDEGQLLTWYGYFTDASAKRTLESLRNCGFEGFDLGVLDGTPETTAHLLPNEVELDIGIDEYQGKERTRVNWVNPIGGNRFLKDKMDPAQKVDFASRMKGTLMALEQPGGTNGGVVYEDDVPFQ